METINIHQAKTHLSSLLERVSRGEEIMIAKAGKPIARLMPLSQHAPPAMKRIGFMKGQFTIPDDFDKLASDDIALMYEGPL
jgi:prevent-host-death family protein